MQRVTSNRTRFQVFPFMGLAALAAVLSVPGHAADGPWEQILRAEDDRQGASPILAVSARSRDVKTRVRTALAYGRIQKPDGVEPLLAFLKDRASEVRENAIFSLGQLGWAEEFSGGRQTEITDRLVPLLKDANPALRAAAAEAIGKLAKSRAPVLLSAGLKDRDARVREAVAFAYQRSRQILKLHDPEGAPPEIEAASFEPFLALARDRDVRVRRAFAVYFSRIRDARGTAALRMLASDGDSQVRALSLAGLGKIGNEKDSDVIVPSLRHRELSVRIAAAQALRGRSAGKLMPPELDRDPSFHVRARVASLTTDVPRLRKLLKDESASVRGEALKSLVRLERDEAPALLATAMADPSWVLRAAAVQAGSGIESDRETRLRGALKDPSAQVRATAVEELVSDPLLASAWAYSAIGEALASPELSVRSAAAAVLGKRREKSVPDLAWKAYLESLDEKWVEARESLMEVVGKSSGDEAVARLRQAAGDPALSVALKARKLLLGRGINLPAPAQAAVVSQSPYRALRFSRDPYLVLETTKGRMEIECFAADAPVHVANVIGFAKAGGYNGLLWHRVVSGFVIQGGDPDGTGWGSAGYSVRAEINRRRFERGSLGMPRAQGFDTGGVQLFITAVPTPHLDGQYTVFGRVVKGLEVVDRIEVGDRILEARVR